MYRFYINRIENDYHYGELARVFLPDDEFEVIPLDVSSRNLALRPGSFLVNAKGSDDRDEIKRELYDLLAGLSGRTPEWGTLTGVRPLKLAYEMLTEAVSDPGSCTDKTGSSDPIDPIDGMCALLAERYLISPSKIALLREIAEYQISCEMGDPSSKAGVYIGIPFCPTRCEYCAFASNVAGRDEIAEYLTKDRKSVV